MKDAAPPGRSLLQGTCHCASAVARRAGCSTINTEGPLTDSQAPSLCGKCVHVEAVNHLLTYVEELHAAVYITHSLLNVLVQIANTWDLFSV
jgi:hypothetical protein